MGRLGNPSFYTDNFLAFLLGTIFGVSCGVLAGVLLIAGPVVVKIVGL
jgi:hypothetical protein